MSRGKGKGKPHWRTGYYADEGHWNEEPSYEHVSYHYDSYQDDAFGGSYVGLFANDEQPEEDAPEEYAKEQVEEGKSKGKLVRSNLTLEQRRAKIAEGFANGFATPHPTPPTLSHVS